jgi:hypothetical protein
MADIKISQLQRASETTANDIFMVVQSNTNKQLTLQTLLSQLNTAVVVNSKMQDLTFKVNGQGQPNLISTNAQTNSVGILTDDPADAKFQVIGDIRVGGELRIVKSIQDDEAFVSKPGLTVGANGSGGVIEAISYKKVTVILKNNADNDITGIFNTNDSIEIAGAGVLNGTFTIGSVTQWSFSYNVPDALNTAGYDQFPANATATKTDNMSGLYKSSTDGQSNVALANAVVISTQFGVTGLTVTGSSDFSLPAGSNGQSKMIYLKSTLNNDSSDKAIIAVPNGIGFSEIQLLSIGNSVSLCYDGIAAGWVCTAFNGANIT